MKRDSSTTNTVISQNAWTYVRYVVRPAMYRVTSGHDPLVIYHPSFLWRGKLLKLYHCEQLARSRQRKRLDSKGGRGSSERVEKTRKKLPPTTIPDKLMIFFSPGMFACPSTLIIADVTTIVFYLRLRVQSSAAVNGFLMHDAQTAFGSRSYGSSSSSLLLPFSFYFSFFLRIRERTRRHRNLFLCFMGQEFWPACPWYLRLVRFPRSNRVLALKKMAFTVWGSFYFFF